MSLAGDWRERHPSSGGKGRLIFYLFLLAFVIFMMLKSETFVSGFNSIFFSSDSSETARETVIE